MLTDDDRHRIKERFDADDAQVERDYLISHVLALLSESFSDHVRFFGGTALSRSFLPDGRLSEDIDLIATRPRRDLAASMSELLSTRLAREFGRPVFVPHLAEAKSAEPSSVTFPSGVSVRIQLLPAEHFPAWPFELRLLEQRYMDVGPARLQVPTRPAFVAWKTAAFIDRQAARDLWDLAALVRTGAFTAEAAEVWRELGPFRNVPTESVVPAAPHEAAWREALSHQTRLQGSASDARQSVIEAWRRLA